MAHRAARSGTGCIVEGVSVLGYTSRCGIIHSVVSVIIKRASVFVVIEIAECKNQRYVATILCFGLAPNGREVAASGVITTEITVGDGECRSVAPANHAAFVTAGSEPARVSTADNGCAGTFVVADDTTDIVVATTVVGNICGNEAVADGIVYIGGSLAIG